MRRSSFYLTLVGCVLLAGTVLHNLVTNTLADTRRVYPLELLRQAAEHFPNAAGVQAQLAAAELAHNPNRSEAIANAEAAAIKATQLLPKSYKMWLVLAEVRQAQADFVGEEAALRQAVALAANYHEVRWLLANQLIRTGQANRLPEAIHEFHLVTQANPALLPAALDLVWRVSSADVNAVCEVAGAAPHAQKTLAEFLAKQTTEAKKQ